MSLSYQLPIKLRTVISMRYSTYIRKRIYIPNANNQLRQYSNICLCKRLETIWAKATKLEDNTRVYIENISDPIEYTYVQNQHAFKITNAVDLAKPVLFKTQTRLSGLGLSWLNL